MNKFFETDEYIVTAYNNRGDQVAWYSNFRGSEICPIVNRLRNNPVIVRVMIDIAFPDTDRDKTLISHLIEPLIQTSTGLENI